VTTSRPVLTQRIPRCWWRPSTQIYETTLMMLAFWGLWRLRDHGTLLGWRFGVYLVLAGGSGFWWSS